MEGCLASAIAALIMGVFWTVVGTVFSAAKKAVTGKSTSAEEDKELDQFKELDKFRQEHEGEAVPDEQTNKD